jgi:hypothetical protein
VDDRVLRQILNAARSHFTARTSERKRKKNMFSMSNLRVGVRLGAGFGVVMLALAVVALLGTAGMNGSISLATHMTSDARNTVALSNAQNAVWALRWGVAQFIAVTDEKSRRQIVEDQPRLKKQFDDAVQSIDVTSLTAEERALSSEMTGAFPGSNSTAAATWKRRRNSARNS